MKGVSMKKVLMTALAALAAGGVWAANTPQIISSQVRVSDPTILDVVYKVVSDKPTVNVRALAFQDGERSFLKVVRPETFVKDLNGNETAKNIGDNIAANVEHSLAWKVSADWAVDLAKVKFEILCSDQGKLPLDWIKIPGLNGDMDVEITTNSHSSNDVENAKFWFYANKENDLVLEDGKLAAIYPTGNVSLSDSNAAIEYICGKMGYELFRNSQYARNKFHYVADALRYSFASYMSFCDKGLSYKPGQYCYVGDKAYLVIDISGGKEAGSYPVAYLDSYPYDGWSDEYKTTKMIFRRIKSAKDFYIGVFEITQSQYGLLTGLDCQGLCPWYDKSSTGKPALTFPSEKIATSGLVVSFPTAEQWMEAFGNSWTPDNDRFFEVGIGCANSNGLFGMCGGVGEWVQTVNLAFAYGGEIIVKSESNGLAATVWKSRLKAVGSGCRLCINAEQ